MGLSGTAIHINLDDAPVRSVNACGDRAEVVRELNFQPSVGNKQLIFHGDGINPDQLEFEIFTDENGKKTAPVDLTQISENTFLLKKTFSQNERVTGNIRHPALGVIVNSFRRMSIQKDTPKAKLETLALVSQQSGQVWRDVDVTYSASCSSKAKIDDGKGEEVDKLHVQPVLMLPQRNSALEHFRIDRIDIPGNGKAATFILKEQNVLVEWRRRIQLPIQKHPKIFISIPGGDIKSGRFLVKEKGIRIFESRGEWVGNSLEIPMGSDNEVKVLYQSHRSNSGKEIIEVVVRNMRPVDLSLEVVDLLLPTRKGSPEVSYLDGFESMTGDVVSDGNTLKWRVDLRANENKIFRYSITQ